MLHLSIRYQGHNVTCCLNNFHCMKLDQQYNINPFNINLVRVFTMRYADPHYKVFTQFILVWKCSVKAAWDYL